MDKFSKVTNTLKLYAESAPEEGTHISYLANASKLYSLYCEMCNILHEDSNEVGVENKLDAIMYEVESITKNKIKGYEEMNNKIENFKDLFTDDRL